MTDFISERYQIIEDLGNMPDYQLLLARDKSLGNENKVLIKRFHLPETQKESRLFQAEKNKLRLLNDVAGFIGYQRIVENEQELLIIQDYIDALSIKEVIKNGYEWSEVSLVSFLIKVVNSLRDARDRGFVCTDVSSESILYDPETGDFWFSNTRINYFHESNDKLSSVQDEFISLAVICLEILQRKPLDKNVLSDIREGVYQLEASYFTQSIDLGNIVGDMLPRTDRTHEARPHEAKAHEDLLPHLKRLLSDPNKLSLRNTSQNSNSIGKDREGENRSAIIDGRNRGSTLKTVEDFKAYIERKRIQDLSQSSVPAGKRQPRTQKLKYIKYLQKCQSDILNMSPRLKIFLPMVVLLIFISLVVIYILGSK